MIVLRGRSGWVLACIGLALFISLHPCLLRAQQGDAPQTLRITPAKLDFGSVAVGTKTQSQTVVLANSGTSTLHIAGILTSGIDFTQTHNCGEHLAPGAQCAIQVTFQPMIPGNRLGTIIITAANDPASPHLVVLNGMGQ